MTPREQRFCYHYHTLRNGREAAVQAGYLAPLAARTAAKLLQRADLQAQIERLDEARSRRDLQKAVQSGLERLAFGGNNDSLRLALLANADEPAGDVLDGLDLFRISECKLKGDAVELKFYDRYQALALLREASCSEQSGDLLKSLFQAVQFPREEEAHAVFPQADAGIELVDPAEPPSGL